MVRVDRERKEPLTRRRRRAAPCAAWSARSPTWTPIIVADYGKGFLTQRARRPCLRRWRGAHGKILTVDPHPYTSLHWRGATAIKPNRAEAFLAAGLPALRPGHPGPSTTRRCSKPGAACCDRWQPRESADHARRARHAAVPRRSAAVSHPRPRPRSLRRLGAGDTAIAVLTLGLASGAAARRSRRAGQCGQRDRGRKLGTATVNIAEITAELDRL